MSITVIPFTQAQDLPDTIIVSNGDHRASVAAEHTGRDAREIERLPFDLSVLENEGAFVVRRATYY